MAKTFYEDLGLEPTATARDIKRQYRALARFDHPDAAGGSDQAFVKLTAAYDTLIDPEKRAAYDKTLAKPAPAPAATTTSTKPRTAPAPIGPDNWWRHITWFRAVIGVLVISILVLLIRVATNWGGGLGNINIPAITPDTHASSSPTPSPSATPADTPTPTPTDTPSPTPTDTPSPTPTGEGVAPVLSPQPPATPF